MNYGISDHCGKDRFKFDEQSTCLDVEGIEKDVITVDKLCESIDHISVIKMCIGNSVIPLLTGAKDTILRNIPKLIISAGVDKRALIDYIPFIDSMVGANRYQYSL